jgi:hypothetical protein
LKYLADADEAGLQIRHVFLTRFHADFVAGHLELHDRCGPGAVDRAAERLDGGGGIGGADSPVLLDVRNPREWASGHIDGSMNIPLNHLEDRIDEIPRERRIAVHCAGGLRGYRWFAKSSWAARNASRLFSTTCWVRSYTFAFFDAVRPHKTTVSPTAREYLIVKDR